MWREALCSTAWAMPAPSDSSHTHTQEKLYSLRIWLRLTNVSQLGRSPGAHSSNEAKMLLCLLLWCVRRTHRLLITPYYSPQPWKFDLSSLCYCTEEFDYFDTVFENYVSSRPVWACAATGRLMWFTQVRHFPGSTSFAGPETTLRAMCEWNLEWKKK